MANKRMFSKSIIDTDAFMDMPHSSQLLYFHLAMRADDDGFVSNPKKIMAMVGCQVDDMNVLIAKKFIIVFESGIVVIKHWLIHNYIQKDRYKETTYISEKNQLLIKDNKGYKLLDTKCIQDVSTDKNRDRLELEIEPDKEKSFIEKDVELTKLLYDLVKVNYSFVVDRRTDKQWEADYQEMNRINRIDGRDYKLIEFVIRFSQQDAFWKQNIRSVVKLRKQFETLMVRAKGQIVERQVIDLDK